MASKTTAPSILEAEPAVLTGALIGYARVSTRDQNLDRDEPRLETNRMLYNEKLRDRATNNDQAELWFLELRSVVEEYESELTSLNTGG